MNARIMRDQGKKFNFDKVELEKGTAPRVIKRVWKYLKHYPIQIMIVCIAIILSVAFNLTLPILLRIAIDDYLKVDEINMMSISLIVASIFAGGLVVSITDFFQQLLMIKVSSNISASIRKDAFNKLVNLPISYFDKNPHGVIMSNITNDVETITTALSQVIPQFITAIFSIAGSIILMFLTSWELSIVAIIVIPFMVIGTVFISKKASKHFQQQQVKIGALNGIVKENINGLKVVKLYNQEEEMKQSFFKANRQLQKASFMGQIYSGMMMPLIRLIDNILYALLVTVGAILKINFGAVSVGQIQATTNYTKLSTRPINSIAQVYNLIQIAIAGGDRVFKLIDEPDEYVNENNKNIIDVKGEVVFKDINFGYTEKLVLKNINFKADSGKTIAIVGPTGGGKTTIINLLMRFYDPTSGKILIDGVDLTTISKDYIRSQIGIVLQTTYLFRGTVLENIKYGKFNATYEEVVEAAKKAHVHDIINRLPKKYETRVKEGGSNFSHGERQLLSIARTILANPKILVLDEATSSVDTRTESNIQKSINSLVKNRTSFIIAHRLQTIKNADEILVIKDGQIYEKGSHKELLEKKGYYYEMYSSQFNIEN